MYWIDKDYLLFDFIKNKVSERWPEKKIQHRGIVEKKWAKNRIIQISTPFPNNDIHYEYRFDDSWKAHIELHIEGRYANKKFSRLVKTLHDQTNGREDFIWFDWFNIKNGSCRKLIKIENENDIWAGLSSLIETFDPILSDYAQNPKNDILGKDDISSKYDASLVFSKLTNKEEKVVLVSGTIHSLFSCNLVIPPYQRIYCWEDKQVKDLWRNLVEIPENCSPLHLGAIILQCKKEDSDEVVYEVIDGQQRLVTLTLILRSLGYEGQMPLLKQRFLSNDAITHIANNKYIIRELVSQVPDNYDLCERIIKSIQFSVLILRDGNLDLAYTFFSNQNSKGVPLSDYDLLKAHHLRYIMEEELAEHMARRWNNLSASYSDLGDYYLGHTVGTHLYRLRKWMRKPSYYDEDRPRRVQSEFSAAPVLSSIPPFGERFYFYEKIQGGSHFFGYAEHFVAQYKAFIQTPHVSLLRQHLQWESHWRYMDVIETLLFGYYLKFGSLYLSEALFCISGVMAQHRYKVGKALSCKIMEYAKNSEIIMMIDQSSSPTFVFAEMIPKIVVSGRDQIGDIKERFYNQLRKVINNLPDFTEKSIIERKNNEY